MAFPNNAILDTANRADENPLSDGGKWTNLVYSNLKIVSNKIVGTGTDNLMYWNPFTLSSNVGEVFVTVATPGTSTNDYMLVPYLNSGSVNGYAIQYIKNGVGGTNDGIYIVRLDAGAGTQIASVTQNISANDGLGLQSILGKHYLWYRSGASGVWNIVASATDTTYSILGMNLALFIEYASTSIGLTNFGGGNYTGGMMTTNTASWGGI